MEKILIIEDDEAISLNLETFFEDEGYEVQVAASSEQGLQTMNNFNPDIAIVDIRLPGEDGNYFMQHALGLNKNLKCIVYTGYLAYTVPQNLQNLGLSQANVIFKPVANMDVLKQSIQNLHK